ncbi:MAG: LON peptidase substrate-binding domain-containing protein [Egibacteraceae bacterium]
MELPLFPLHLVLFPGRPLPLHIFEPRYRQMLRDCLDGDRRFGVLAIRAGRETGHDTEVFDIGTVAEIEAVEQLPDGRSDVFARGVQRFRLHRLVPGTPYLKGQVELLDEPTHREVDNVQAKQLRELLLCYLRGLGAPTELLERVPNDPNELAYLAGAAVQVEIPEQQKLLELGSTTARLEATLRLLRREAGLMRHLGTVGSLRPPGPCGADLN